MGKLLIINGSPRAPKSNSKKYARLVKDVWDGETAEYSVVTGKHEEAVRQAGECDHVLFVFPLYVDAIPAVPMNFMKVFEKAKLSENARIHVLVNCGFFEPEQNDTALEIFRYYCRENGFSMGTALRIASGEAILTTPFAFLVKRKVKKLAGMIRSGKSGILTVSMPLTKKMFLGASKKYWIRYGGKYHVSEEEMRSMEIEEERNA